jgi:hypothetical protein
MRSLFVAALGPTNDNSPLSGTVVTLLPSTATLRHEESVLEVDMVALFIGNQGHLI